MARNSVVAMNPHCTHCQCFRLGEACCWCADNMPCWREDEEFECLARDERRLGAASEDRGIDAEFTPSEARAIKAGIEREENDNAE